MEYKKCPCCELNYIIKGKELLCKACLRSPRGRDFILKNLSQEKLDNIRKIKEEKQKKKEEEKVFLKQKAKEELLRILESFGFEGFLHTADFKNFIEIFKSGRLMSREELINRGVCFIDNAEAEIIENTAHIYKKHTRFYYRPKTPTNYAALKWHNQNSPVMMVFDKNLIYFEDVIFADGGVAAKRTNITRDPQIAQGFDWKQIFRDDPFTPEEVLMNELGCGPKNHRNAEFLCGKSVEIDKVKKVYFKNKKDLDMAIDILGNDPRFEYKPDKFYGG